VAREDEAVDRLKVSSMPFTTVAYYEPALSVDLMGADFSHSVWAMAYQTPRVDCPLQEACSLESAAAWVKGCCQPSVLR
jgi:hypothetical protein